MLSGSTGRFSKIIIQCPDTTEPGVLNFVISCRCGCVGCVWRARHDFIMHTINSAPPSTLFCTGTRVLCQGNTRTPGIVPQQSYRSHRSSRYGYGSVTELNRSDTFRSLSTIPTEGGLCCSSRFARDPRPITESWRRTKPLVPDKKSHDLGIQQKLSQKKKEREEKLSDAFGLRSPSHPSGTVSDSENSIAPRYKGLPATVDPTPIKIKGWPEEIEGRPEEIEGRPQPANVFLE